MRGRGLCGRGPQDWLYTAALPRRPARSPLGGRRRLGLKALGGQYRSVPPGAASVQLEACGGRGAACRLRPCPGPSWSRATCGCVASVSSVDSSHAEVLVAPRSSRPRLPHRPAPAAGDLHGATLACSRPPVLPGPRVTLVMPPRHPPRSEAGSSLKMLKGHSSLFRGGSSWGWGGPGPQTCAGTFTRHSWQWLEGSTPALDRLTDTVHSIHLECPGHQHELAVLMDLRNSCSEPDTRPQRVPRDRRHPGQESRDRVDGGCRAWACLWRGGD